MALRLREHSTRSLDLLLAATVVAVVVFGGLFTATRDWLAGAFAIVAAVGAVRLGTLRFRLRGAPRDPAARLAAGSDDATEDPAAARGESTGAEPAFVTGARHVLGARSREGYVVIGRDAAGFVPTAQWRHIAAEIGLGLIATRVDLSRIALDADDEPALGPKLAAMIEHRDGLILDERWAWARPVRALVRTETGDTLTLDRDPPATCLARWATLSPAPAAQTRRTVVRIAVGAGAIVAVLGGAGVAAWRVTDNVDFLIAGLSFAGLIAGSVITGLVIGSKRLAGR